MTINKILEKYKLTRTFETELNVEKEFFINEFKQITEKEHYTPFFIMLDIFYSGNKKYIGNINSNNFKIRERFIIKNSFANNFASVKSDFYVENNKLKVKTKIQGMEILPFILRVIILGIYSLLMLTTFLEILLMSLSSDAQYIDISMVMGPIMLSVFVVLLTYTPYKTAKKNVVNKKNDIDLIYQLIEKMSYSNV